MTYIVIFEKSKSAKNRGLLDNFDSAVIHTDDIRKSATRHIQSDP